MKEYKVKKLSKLVENGFGEWIVMFDGQEIGKVEKNFNARCYTYRAISQDGRYIGSGSSKHEAKFFVSRYFLETQNIEVIA